MRWMALTLLAAAVACSDQPDTAEPAERTVSIRAATTAAGPRVVLLTTRADATHSELVFQPIGAATPAAAVARVEHGVGAEVRGALVPQSSKVVVVADAERRRDLSFGARLFVLAEGEPTRALVGEVVHSTRPLVLEDGRVFVERGRAGTEPDADATQRGELRTDALQIDEIDLDSGKSRQVHAFSGYTTHLAGALGRELIVYRVRFQHAELVALDADSGSVRHLAAVPAFARDFSVDRARRELVYTTRDDEGWIVERMSLVSGARSLVVRVGGIWATPRVLADGILINDGLGGRTLGSSVPFDRPLGDGFDELSAVSADGAWAVLQHRVPSQFSTPFALELATGAVSTISLPAGVRSDIAGVLP